MPIQEGYKIDARGKPVPAALSWELAITHNNYAADTECPRCGVWFKPFVGPWPAQNGRKLHDLVCFDCAATWAKEARENAPGWEQLLTEIRLTCGA